MGQRWQHGSESKACSLYKVMAMKVVTAVDATVVDM